MQRTVSVLLTSFLAGLLLTACPEKKVEKEEPASPTSEKVTGASDKNGADDKAAEDEHGDEADDHAEAPGEDKKPSKKHRAEKKEPAAAEKDQGGW